MDLIEAHKAGVHHRAVVERSGLCGCFYCLETFKPSEIREWTDAQDTALCPKCGIDSVLGDQSGFPLTPEFLSAMSDYWFSS